MQYIIYNTDGSIAEFIAMESIQQGDDGTKKIFVSILDTNIGEYTCTAQFELPNGEITELSGVADQQEVSRIQRTGYTITLTQAETRLAGNLKVNLKLVNLQGGILCSYQGTYKINPTAYSPNDTLISQAQYNSFLQTLASFISRNEAYSEFQEKLIAGANITIENNVISATGGGGGGDAVWGSIAGDINNQTDLKAALNAKQDTLIGTQTTGQNIKTINGQSILGSGNIDVQASSVTWGDITGNIIDQLDLQTALRGKQATLVSGTNIKTINNESILDSGNLSLQPLLVSGVNIRAINNISILGSGNFDLQPTLVSGTNIKTINNQTLLGSGNIDIQGSVTVDSQLSTTSTNPVQNKVITNNLNKVLEVARGKSQTYILSYSDTLASIKADIRDSDKLMLLMEYDGVTASLTNIKSAFLNGDYDEYFDDVHGMNKYANPYFNSQNNEINLNESQDFTTFVLRLCNTEFDENIDDYDYILYRPYIDGETFNPGDMILITETDVPNRWVGGKWVYYKTKGGSGGNTAEFTPTNVVVGQNPMSITITMSGTDISDISTNKYDLITLKTTAWLNMDLVLVKQGESSSGITYTSVFDANVSGYAVFVMIFSSNAITLQTLTLTNPQWYGTQAQYEALGTYDSNTIYNIWES